MGGSETLSLQPAGAASSLGVCREGVTKWESCRPARLTMALCFQARCDFVGCNAEYHEIDAYHELIDASRISSDLVPERSLLIELILGVPAPRATACRHIGSCAEDRML
jgi:hypothetical protein